MESTTNPSAETVSAAEAHDHAASIAQVSVKLLAPFERAIVQLRLSADAALSRVGLSRSVFDNPDMRISHALADQLLRAATGEHLHRDLGLLAAEQSRPQNFDIVEYLARSQPHVRAGLEAIARYRALLHSALQVELELVGDRVWLRVDFAGLEIADSAFEFVLAMFTVIVRRITGRPELSPLEVRFRHPRPRSVAVHERVFRSPVMFEQPTTVLVYAVDVLEMSLVDADLGLAAVLERHAAARLERLGKDVTLPERVRALQRDDIGVGRLTAETLARQLGMSARTMHRKLAAHGCNYQSLLDSARREVALRYLRDPNVSIREIGDRVGFNQGPTFHRAFRRWTGTTPSAFRASLKRSD